MTVDPDRALLGASLAFAGAAVLGSAVAIRDQLPGQPFGVSIPLSVPAGLAAGWGAGVAAPWPMPETTSYSPVSPCCLVVSVLPVDYRMPDAAHAAPEPAAPGGCAGGPGTVGDGRCLFPFAGWLSGIAVLSVAPRRLGGDALAFLGISLGGARA